MLVFPATSYRPDAFVAAAAELDIELVVATDLAGFAGRFSGASVAVDFDDPSRGVAHWPAVDGVVAVDERSALVAAAMAESGRCARPYHCLEGVRAALDKGVMRALLHRAGVPNPVIRARVARQDGLPDVPFPCVVKPPRLSGSQGVIRADDRPALATALSRTRRILHRHPSAFGADDAFFEIVVEDYVEGAEVAVEGLMRGGTLLPIAIFDKPDALCGPFFEETIYTTPSTRSAVEQRALYQVAEHAALALGLSDGPVHAELRLGEHGPQLIEIAARSIGGLCSRVLRPVVGSLEKLLLCHAVGRPLPARSASDQSSGVMMMPVPRSGVFRRARGLHTARGIAGVDAVVVAIRPGEIVRQAPDGASYLGFVFAHGGDVAVVTQSLRSAHRAIRFELTPLLDVSQ